MTPALRRRLALFLALALALWGHALASARPGLAEGRLVTFCAGGGLVRVEVGADGQPTGESHLCPDLAAVALAGFAAPAPVPARPATQARTFATTALAAVAPLLLHLAFAARAPPVRPA